MLSKEYLNKMAEAYISEGHGNLWECLAICKELLPSKISELTTFEENRAYVKQVLSNYGALHLINKANNKVIAKYNRNISNSGRYCSYNASNYHSHSYGIFKCCKAPNRPPDFVSNSGSLYWLGCDKQGEFVIRKSDHWSKVNNKKYTHVQINGCISSCFWVLNLTDSTPMKSAYAGKCYFSSLKINVLKC